MVRRRGGELPEEILPSSSRREVLMGSFALVALVVALNLAAAAYVRAYSPNRGYWLAAAKWQMLEDLEEPVDTLVLGDSSCNQGLIPEIVDEILGGPTINLCTIGDMTVVNDAWMLSGYLAKLPPPRRIVSIHTYDVWERDESALRSMAWRIHRYRDLWSPAEPRMHFSFGEGLMNRIGRWVPLFTQNATLIRRLRSPDLWFVRDEGFDLSASGFMARTVSIETVRQAAQQHTQSAEARRERRMSAGNLEALRILAKVAAEYQIPLYVVNAPIYEGMFAIPGFRSMYQGVIEEVVGVVSATDAGRFLFALPLTFPAEEMQNVDHVAGPDAPRRYSTLVAQEIREIESRNRLQ